MARVPYTGVPESAPDTQVPSDYLHLDVSPDEFGAPIAQGLEKLGQGAIDASKFYGAVAADDANNSYVDSASKIRANMHALSGRAALNYLPEAQQQLSDLFDDTKGSLQTEESRLQFDQISRRYRSLIDSDVQDYAAGAMKQYGRETNLNTISVNKNAAAFAQQRNDQAGLSEAQNNIRTAYAQGLQIDGLDSDPVNVRAAMLSADRDFNLARINGALGQGDSASALKILRANSSTLAGMPDYDRVEQSITRRVQDVQLGQFTQTLQAQGASPAPTASAGGGMNLKGAILGQESGDNSNAPTSYAGAVGPGQIEPGTFAMYARPGEDINNPNDNKNVSGRIVDDYTRRYNGDASRVAVAYASGPGNVAPPGSPNPWKNDSVVDKRSGITVSQYTADVLKRAQGGSNAPLDPRAWAEQQWPGDAEFADRAATAAEKAAAWQRVGLQSTFSNAEAMVSDGRIPAQWPTPQQIASAYPNDPAKAQELTARLSGMQAIAPKIARLPDMTPQQIAQTAQQLAPDPNNQSDYAQRSRLYGIWQSAVTGYQKTLATDPAGTMIQSHPNIAAKWSAAQKDAGQFGAYVADSLAAQATAGVPPQWQRVLPVTYAKSIVSTLQSAPPAQAAQKFQSMEAELGPTWPRIYGELARAGLPGQFQALAVANPSDRTTIANAIQKSFDGSGKNAVEDSLSGYRTTDGHNYVQAIDQALATDAGLNNLGRSYGVAGRAGIDLFSSVRSAVRTTALYLSATTGMAPSDAAARAAKMVTSPFNFIEQPGRPPVRLPANLSSDEFRLATSDLLSRLTGKDVAPYVREGNEEGEPLTSTAEQLRSAALQGARHAFWIAVPGSDGTGAVRAMDPQSGHPVLRSNGRPLEVPFRQIPGLAMQARRNAASAQNTYERELEFEATQK